MPPGIEHPNYVCWDSLETPERAMLIGFSQTSGHDEFEKLKLSAGIK